jgi:hypothetical protein
MNKKTVYVIGAGASKEANLPTGEELKEEISNLLNMHLSYSEVNGDELIVEALWEVVKGPNGERGSIRPYLDAARHIREAMPQAISIDNFINDHRENEKIAMCGKLAIVRSILQAERNSLLYFERHRADSNIDFSYLGKTWYLPFFRLLTENCQKGNLKKRLKTIVLIIFNYDRCVEHFMYHALQNYYRISPYESANLISCINIYHPYGSVGSLPWLDNSDSYAMEFGDLPKRNQLLHLVDKVKTFAEGMDPNSSDILAIRKHMADAHRLVFMGFAFHKLNMQLIAPDTKSKGLRLKCYATTFGISRSDKEVIRKQISTLYNNALIDTKMADRKCVTFFSEFWRSLAF